MEITKETINVDVFPWNSQVSSFSLCYSFDVVFNTAGPVAHQFCLNLCSPEGSVITPVCSSLASDSYGFIFGSLYSAWVQLAHVSKTIFILKIDEF